MTENQEKALYLLSVYTAGKFTLWNLSGNGNVKKRVAILTALRGEKVPQAKAGVSVLEREFHALAETTGGCGAEREENFVNWAKNREQTGEETAIISRQYRSRNACFAEYVEVGEK